MGAAQYQRILIPTLRQLAGTSNSRLQPDTYSIFEVTKMRSLVFACIVCQIVAVTCLSADGLIASRLTETRKAHAEQIERLRKDVESGFEKQERAARSSGNKKLLDQLAEERRAFEEKRELPTFCPEAAIRRVATARVALEGAYSNAIRESLKAKQDGDAQALEKELREILIASRSIRFLNEITPTTIEVDGDLYSNSGKVNGRQVKIDGRDQLHSIFLHPKARGPALASYRLNRQWSELRGEACIPRMGDERGRIESPVVFEILGDKKVLWTSKPIQEFDQRQAFQVEIEKAEMLHLRVKCPGKPSYARAVWIEPVLVR